jgi:pimeloyl-ACP methyl ester carboxylesterase
MASPVFHVLGSQPSRGGWPFLRRANARTVDRDPESSEAVMSQQAKALIGWCATRDPDNKILGSINQPVLVASGSNDTMLPVSNVYLMFKHLKDAQLTLYSDAGHGALFQYPVRFVNHAVLFLAE